MSSHTSCTPRPKGCLRKSWVEQSLLKESKLVSISLDWLSKGLLCTFVPLLFEVDGVRAEFPSVSVDIGVLGHASLAVVWEAVGVSSASSCCPAEAVFEDLCRSLVFSDADASHGRCSCSSLENACVRDHSSPILANVTSKGTSSSPS